MTAEEATEEVRDDGSLSVADVIRVERSWGGGAGVDPSSS